jgi:cysteine desulfurase/selenocysteine lyase
MIYLDHAATSFPKPPQVLRAMNDFLERAGGNPGRSGHRLSIDAGRIVYDAREAIAELFNARDPLRVIFTLNATHAINLALHGMVRAGDRIVTTSMEHNAVMRPLRAMERHGVRVIVVPCNGDGSLDMNAMQNAITPSTRLVVINHASNIVGTILPIAEIAKIAHGVGALVLVDTAQTAGVVPIDVQAMGIDLLAFTGHKSLQGPPGTGGLVIGENVDAAQIEPLMRGGTGSRSEFEEQPDELPDKFESGTPNGVGIAGLGAGVRFILERGIEAIRAHEIELTRMLIEGLQNIPSVVVHGTRNAEKSTAVVSFTVEKRQVSEIGLRLEEECDVLCRVGLHCAPAAHRTIGTFPKGTVRFAPGIFTTHDDIGMALAAVEKIVR